jgi:hypothetical protein
VVEVLEVLVMEATSLSHLAKMVAQVEDLVTYTAYQTQEAWERQVKVIMVVQVHHFLNKL